MHRRASHAILMHRRGFSTFHRECVASQRVAGPIASGTVQDVDIIPEQYDKLITLSARYPISIPH